METATAAMNERVVVDASVSLGIAAVVTQLCHHEERPSWCAKSGAVDLGCQAANGNGA